MWGGRAAVGLRKACFHNAKGLLLKDKRAASAGRKDGFGRLGRLFFSNAQMMSYPFPVKEHAMTSGMKIDNRGRKMMKCVDVGTDSKQAACDSLCFDFVWTIDDGDND